MNKDISEVAEQNCEECDGTGITDAWSSPDGDFDFEICTCIPGDVDFSQLIMGM